jgi:hypothetical protein
VLGLARYHHHRSIIFRRVSTSLPAIIDRSRAIYNPEGLAAPKDSFNEGRLRWKFEDGRQVRFGSIQFEKDVTDYHGQPHDLYAFDEITEFSERQFRYVTGWNRTVVKGQRCRIVGTGNPPTTAEGEWVMDFWGPWINDRHPHPAKPGELRWYSTINGKDVELESGDPVRIDGELVTPRSRTFIPARVEDNPYLIEAGYVATLQALPEPLRSKLLYGDFRAGREDNAYQIIPSEWVRQAQERWVKREKPDTPMTALGVDVARGGGAKTVLSPAFDNYFAEQLVHPGSSTPDGPAVATLVIQARTDDALVKVDVIGVGTSVYDHLRSPLKSRVVALNGGARDGTKRDKSGQLAFANLRAQWWWRLREALDPTSGQDLCIPPDPELRVDLCAPTWHLSARGIQVESKDELVKRLGRSPDKGDSLVYAHASTKSGDLDFLRTMAER